MYTVKRFSLPLAGFLLVAIALTFVLLRSSVRANSAAMVDNPCGEDPQLLTACLNQYDTLPGDPPEITVDAPSNPTLCVEMTAPYTAVDCDVTSSQNAECNDLAKTGCNPCGIEWSVVCNGEEVDSEESGPITFTSEKIGTHTLTVTVSQTDETGFEQIQFEVPQPDLKASVTPNQISTCETAKASLGPDPCLPVEWRIAEGHHLATVDEATGVVTPRPYADSDTGDKIVTLEGRLAGNPAYKWTTQLRIGQGGCGGCGGSVASGGDSDGGSSGGGGGGGAGNMSALMGSVDVAWGLGRSLDDGESAGVMWMHADEPSETLATPASLMYNAAPEGVTAINDAEGSIRQISAPELLMDVITVDDYSFRVDMYLDEDRGTFNQQSNLWEPDGDPFVQYLVANPDGLTSYDRLQISKIIDSATVRVWTYDSTGNEDWTLIMGDGANTELRREESVFNGDVRRYKIKDAQGQVVYDREDTFATYTFEDGQYSDTVDVVVQSVVDPDNAALTTTTAYYENGSGPGRVGKVHWQKFADGSWIVFDYNLEGWIISELRPWLDQLFDPLELPDPADSRVITYDYTPVDGPEDPDPDTGAFMPMRPRTIREIVLDQVVRTTYYAIYDDGTPTVIEMRANYPEAQADDETNVVTKWTYTDDTLEKLYAVYYPYEDGTDQSIDYYTYQTGTYTDAGDPLDSEFEVDPEGEDRRVIIERVRANQSTLEHRVTDRFGNPVMDEMLINGNGNPRIGATVRRFDERGRLKDTYFFNGTHSQQQYDCCHLTSATDESGIETTYQYDDLGRLQSTTRIGVEEYLTYAEQPDLVTSYSYDAAGRTLSTTRSGGGLSLATSQTYDLAGRVLTSTGEDGLVTEYDYDTTSAGARKETVTRPGGFTEVTEYFRDGRVKSRTGTALVAQYLEYDVNIYGEERTKTYVGSSDSPRWSRTSTGMLGHTVREERPAFGGGTVVWDSEYDYTGRLIRTTTPGQEDTLYFYDPRTDTDVMTCLDLNTNGTWDQTSTDRLTKRARRFEQSSDGEWWEVSTVTISALNNEFEQVTVSKEKRRLTSLSASMTSMTKTVDVNGNETIRTTTVDRVNKIVTQSINVPDSDRDVYSVTRNGLTQLTRTVTELETTYAYDGLGRQILVTDPRGNTTQTTFDAQGRVDFTENGHNDLTSYAYDPVTGRLLSVENADAGMTYYEYNNLGATTRIWGDVPQPVEIAYDETYGDRISLKTYRGGTGWEGPDWPTSPGDADITTWEYDEPTGLVTAKVYDDSSEVQYDYTPEGKLATRTWARTVSGGPLVTSYAYDPQTAELIGVDYSDTPATPDVAFTYQRFGAPEVITDAVGTRTFTYSATTLQPEKETFSNGILTKEIRRTYETSGVLGRYNGLQVGLPQQGTDPPPPPDYQVDYYYDARGRLSRIVGPGLPAYGAEYSFLADADMVEKTQFKSGSATGVAETVRSFETQRDLVTVVENKWLSPAATLSKYEYHYDDLGRRTDVATTGTGFNLDRFTLFTYNDRSELLTSKRYNGTDLEDLSNPVAAQQYTFNFDPIGNRTNYTGEDPPVTTTYTANNLNQYSSTSSPSESFTHDADGNLTQDAMYDYTWDAENRLVSVTPRAVITGSKKCVFTYDYMGRRARKQVYTYSSGQWGSTPSTDIKYIYDGWNLILELNGLASDAVLRKYTWGLDLSGQAGNNTPSPSQGEGWGEGALSGMHGAGGIGGLLAMRDVATSTSLLYLYDANGNVGQLIKTSDGSFGAKYQYYPYGGEIQAVGSYATVNPFRFSTKFWDTEHQALYYGYRYHKPKLGRWLSRDPIEERGGANLFSFVLNCPTMGYDPLGLTPIAVEFNAFIPDRFGEWQQEPGDWTNGPFVENQFATDNRGFGGGSSRLRTRVEVDSETIGKAQPKITVEAGPSHRKTLFNGAHLSELERTAVPSWRSVVAFAHCSTRVCVYAEAAYPFVFLAPDIDYRVCWNFTAAQNDAVTINVFGEHDKFPNYEALILSPVKDSQYQYDTTSSGPGLYSLWLAGRTSFDGAGLSVFVDKACCSE